MRALEFVVEQKVGDVGKRRRYPTRGLHKFRDEQFADRIYELNRVMMAAASTDGTFVPDLDAESWAGRHDIAAPYTKQEANMMKRAYEATGAWHRDLNGGDMESSELPSTNKSSPVKGFAGYPRR
jgi:hypothetical protein